METQRLLLHKYEPKCLDDFEQKDIVTLLKKFIEIDIIKILFVSKQSNGKTTFIKAIINEYYKGETEHVLFINNVKEYGVSYYKNEVKHFCKTPSSRKKMIVLDDFDYMNEQNQQIFKNIIEKFNLHYIISCSNPQKVLLNIQSLMNIIEIKKMPRENMLNIYNRIKMEEDLDICEEVENYIIDTNVNQMINNMEKYILMDTKITLEIAKQSSSDIKASIFENYLHELKNKNLNACIAIFYNLHGDGYSVIDILYNFYNFIKNEDLPDTFKYNLIPYISKYINNFHNIHEDIIELALFTNNILKL
jgi:DNA polymerase III delta prime subunit